MTPHLPLVESHRPPPPHRRRNSFLPESLRHRESITSALDELADGPGEATVVAGGAAGGDELRSARRGEDRWRSRRVGRGIPEFANRPRPRAQVTVHTDQDVALMLTERGELQPAPDGEEEEDNFLKKFYSSKTSWIYRPSDADISYLARSKSKPMNEPPPTKKLLTTWTHAGRLLCVEQTSTCKAVPEDVYGGIPEHIQERPPMTRGEVTDARLIRDALSEPPPPPSFGVAGVSARRGRRADPRRQWLLTPPRQDVVAHGLLQRSLGTPR